MLLKRTVMGLILSVFIISIPITVNPSSVEIVWLTLEKAQQAGQDRKFFLYFYADWCGFCRKLENVTFREPAVAEYINRHYIPIRINIDKQKQLAVQYGVRGVPDLQFFSSQWENIARLPGYIEAINLLPILKYINTDSYLTQEYSQFLKEHS